MKAGEISLQKKKRKRKKRIKIINEYKDEEKALTEEVEKLQMLIAQKEEKINQIRIKETECGLELYKEKELREEIFRDIEHTTFSKTILDKMKTKYTDEKQWNQDTVTLETVEIIYSMDEFLLEKSKSENPIIYTVENIGDKVIRTIEEEQNKNDT